MVICRDPRSPPLTLRFHFRADSWRWLVRESNSDRGLLSTLFLFATIVIFARVSPTRTLSRCRIRLSLRFLAFISRCDRRRNFVSLLTLIYS